MHSLLFSEKLAFLRQVLAEEPLSKISVLGKSSNTVPQDEPALPSHASSPLRSSAGARLSHTQIGVAMHVDSSPTDSQRVEHVSDVLSQSQSILSLHLLFFPSRASQASGGADGGVYGGSEGGADGGAFGSGGGVDGGADGPTGRHFPPNPKDAKE